MKRIILIITLCMASIHGNTEAKETDSSIPKDPSGLSGYFGIFYNSVEYDNWFSPFGSSATTGGFKLGLNYTLKKDKHEFLATLYQSYVEYESGDPSIKLKYSDMLVLNFSYGYDINKSIKPVGILHVRTIATETTTDLQIGTGTGVALAKPFDPAYIFGGLGVEYNGSKYLSIKLSPLGFHHKRLSDDAMKLIWKNTNNPDNEIAYGFITHIKVPKVKLFTRYSGVKEINLSMNSDILGFMDYKNPEDIYFYNQTTLTLNLTKLFSINYSVLYDLDPTLVSPMTEKEQGLQKMEDLTIGIQFKYPFN